MGFGLPAAIGAKVAAPNKTVVDIDGDASFSMTAMELATASQYDIGVKVLILNNEFQGMVVQWQGMAILRWDTGAVAHNLYTRSLLRCSVFPHADDKSRLCPPRQGNGRPCNPV